jgi:hypothetical protein
MVKAALLPCCDVKHGSRFGGCPCWINRPNGRADFVECVSHGYTDCDHGNNDASDNVDELVGTLDWR